MILANLQEGWLQPTNAGDDGGPSSRPSGTFTMVPGPIATFSAYGAYPYNNGYWYKRLGANDDANLFSYGFEFLYPTAADLAACQALEFELQQTIGSRVYNMAWQMRLVPGDRFWYTFDYATSQWQKVAIAAPALSAGQWVNILATFERTKDIITHKYLWVNGVMTEVGIARNGFTRAGYQSSLNAGFQLDTNGQTPPSPYSVKVRDMKIGVETASQVGDNTGSRPRRTPRSG